MSIQNVFIAPNGQLVVREELSSTAEVVVYTEFETGERKECSTLEFESFTPRTA